MEDIYQNRVSYSHDGSNSLKDRFTFTVSDGTNPFFIIEEGGKEVRGTDREGLPCMQETQQILAQLAVLPLLIYWLIALRQITSLSLSFSSVQ
jgi:hypothetical protein